MATEEHNTPTKICTVCHIEKPATVEYFHFGRRGLYRLRAHCKQCASIYSKKWAETYDDNMSTKVCARCRKEKENTIDYFGYRDRNRNRMRRICKQCENEKSLFYYQKYKEEINKRNLLYREKNKERIHKQQRLWREKNKKKIREKHLLYYANNKEKIYSYQRLWRKKNPELVREAAKKRRARESGVTICDFTAAEWKTMQEHYDHRCVYCGKRRKGKLTQDHIQPLSKGGNHTATNIVPSCQSCNARKWSGPPLVPVQPILLLR